MEEKKVNQSNETEEPVILNLSGEEEAPAAVKRGWLAKMRHEDKLKETSPRTEEDILRLNDKLNKQQQYSKITLFFGLLLVGSGIVLNTYLGLMLGLIISGAVVVLLSVYFNNVNFRLVVKSLEKQILKDGVKTEAEIADCVVIKSGKTYRECRIMYRIRGTKKMVFRIESYDNLEAIPVGKKYEIAYERTSGYCVKIKEIEDYSPVGDEREEAADKIAAAENALK